MKRERSLLFLVGNLSSRGVLQRYLAGLLVFASAGLLFFSGTDSEGLANLRAALLDATAGVTRVIDRPVQSVWGVVEDARLLLQAHDENERLRQENRRLQGWEALARSATRENAELREALTLVSEDRPPFVSARVVGASASAPLRTVVIDRGASDGVKVGDAVVTPDGLVGHVVEAGRGAARVLLLTNAISQIPVFGDRSGKTAVLTGNRSALLDLAYFDHATDAASFSEGEFLYTSGQGGLFPASLLVGTVVRVDGSLRVLPAVDWGGMRFVQVVGGPGIPTAGSGPAIE